MVSIINPGVNTGAGALGIETRTSRTLSPLPRQDQPHVSNDRVEIGDAAAWRATRESVRAGLEQISLALTLARETQSFLGRVQELASADDQAAAQEELDKLLADFAARVDDAVAGGGRIVAGEGISVQAEPGAAPLSIAGLDLRLKNAPAAGDPVSVPRDATISAALLEAARASLGAVQAGIDRLSEAARNLEAHQGFLGAADAARLDGVRADLDADAARLLALQVRQGLNGADIGAIANVEPAAVLSLFRA